MVTAVQVYWQSQRSPQCIAALLGRNRIFDREKSGLPLCIVDPHLDSASACISGILMGQLPRHIKPLPLLPATPSCPTSPIQIPNHGRVSLDVRHLASGSTTLRSVTLLLPKWKYVHMFSEPDAYLQSCSTRAMMSAILNHTGRNRDLSSSKILSYLSIRPMPGAGILMGVTYHETRVPHLRSNLLSRWNESGVLPQKEGFVAKYGGVGAGGGRGRNSPSTAGAGGEVRSPLTLPGYLHR
ncbi:hypothetical protein EVAR_83846_1 [Eumeta japonica]|uniref:Uncharacterized protein n=1 Tax=Eumeta variegata TaxID=151549 RepID=A0A4C1USE3_EUMVA|nr:hypothetical protein EVAR_83846_1 [Eumeta japonica]